jgi:hypothetical protein
MLVTKLCCPNCKTILRPAKPLPVGKKVKCPKCSNDFTAADGDADKPAAAAGNAAPAAKDKAAAAPKKKADKPAAKKAGPAKPAEETVEEDSAGTYGIVAADRPKTEEDLENEDEDGEDNEGKVSFVPDHSIKDLRGPAQALIMRPSNLLISNGVVGFFGWVILFIIMILPVVFPVLEDEDAAKGKDAPPKQTLILPDGLSALGDFPKNTPNTGPNPPPPPPQTQPPTQTPPQTTPPPPKKKSSLYMIYTWDLKRLTDYPWYLFTLFLTPIFIGIAYACVMTYGAVKMQNLESRVWGLVASAMCMFPMATWGFVTVCSMVISLVVSMLADEIDTVLFVLIAFVSLETLGCISIGLFSLLTLLKPEVIDGYEYVPDA